MDYMATNLRINVTEKKQDIECNYRTATWF